MPIIIIVMIFLTIALLVGGIAFAMSNRDPVAAKIGMSIEQEKEVESIRLARENAKLDRFLSPFKDRIRKDESNGEESIEKVDLLSAAGYYSPRAGAVFLAIRLTLSVVLAVSAATFVFLGGITTSPLVTTFGVVLLGAIGYYGPVLVISSKAKDNRKKFSNGLPDALDMTLICLEAGQSFPVALQFVAKEFRNAHPEVAKQFEIVTLEFRAGRKRSDALKNMARRVDLQELTSIVNMVNQSESLGTSLTGAIRAAAFDMRRDRMLRAEEKANKLPVLMSVPLTTCIFPTLFMVILVPVMINIVENIPG